MDDHNSRYGPPQSDGREEEVVGEGDRNRRERPAAKEEPDERRSPSQPESAQRISGRHAPKYCDDHDEGCNDQAVQQTLLDSSGRLERRTRGCGQRITEETQVIPDARGRWKELSTHQIPGVHQRDAHQIVDGCQTVDGGQESEDVQDGSSCYSGQMGLLTFSSSSAGRSRS